MKATIPELTAARTSVQQIDIGQLNAGPLAIGRLVIENGHVNVSTGAAQFRNLRITVGLAFTLTWQVRVSIPLVGTWTWGDTADLGSHSVTVGLGDFSLPGLEAFSLDVAGLEVDNLQAVVGPLQNLRLGPLVAERLAVQDVQAPVIDFQLLGLTLGRLALEGFSSPTAAAGSTRVGRVQGEAFPLGTVTLPGLSLPQASAGDIVSKALDASGTGRPLSFPVDAGVLTLTLAVTPSAQVEADELRLSNVRSSARLGTIELRDVVLPYEILDLTLSQIGIETVDLPKIEVS